MIFHSNKFWRRETDKATIPDTYNDAIATKNITFSSHVANMHGCCVTSVLVEKGLDGADNYFFLGMIKSICEAWGGGFFTIK